MSEATQNAVELHKVSVRYGKLKALDEVSLNVNRGSVYALLGRNGAGKTSMIRTLMGFQKPDSGLVRIFGEDVWTRRAGLMNRVGLVPEDPDAPPEMSVKELLAFCARLYSKWDAASCADRMSRFDVPMNVPFGRMSKGQRREVMLSIVLATSPELLILDDPTLGLDVVARRELFEELVSELADRGTTVVVTTHDLPGIESIANRVGIMRSGHLVMDEDLEALKQRFRKIRFASAAVPASAAELQDLKAVGFRRWGNGVEAVVANYDDVSLERFRSSTGIREVEVSAMSLEEIFIAITGEKGAQS